MKKIVRMVFGSHMYGLANADSDMDYKGIYLPELDELLLGTYKPTIKFSTGNDESKNGAGDIDDDWMALPTFLNLAVQGETVAIDMLHSDPKFWEMGEYGYIWDALVDARSQFYTKNLKAYMGYVKRQAAKYGIKGSRMAALTTALEALDGKPADDLLGDHWDALPESEHAEKIVKEGAPEGGKPSLYYMVNGKCYQNTVRVDYARERFATAYKAYGARARQAEKNEGVDWKAVSHALRAGYQLEGILVNGTFSYPLPKTDFLRSVKQGELDFKTEVSPVLEDLVDRIDALTDRSTLPNKVDKAKWDQWLIGWYHSVLIEPQFGSVADWPAVF